MKSLGVYDLVKDRLLLGDSVMQAAQFVESGGAEVGIISYSLALAPRLRDKGRFWEVPIDAYPRREQGGVDPVVGPGSSCRRGTARLCTG